MPLRLHAVNTALESENKIHDDSVAAGFGFKGGLVPGVTVYGYLTSAAIEHFGDSWLERGAMDVRFDQPIFDGDEVVVSSDVQAVGRVRITAGTCATGIAWMDSPQPQPAIAEASVFRRAASMESLAPGTVLGSVVRKLDLSQSRMSAPLDPAVGTERLAHPAILLALANEIFVANYELGPWIHVSSEVRKAGVIRDGEEIRVHARVAELFERKGHQFVTLDVQIAGDGECIAENIRHTAIWSLRPPK